MATYPGRNGIVYLSADGVSAATAVLNLNKWTLSRATDKIDVTSFGQSNKTYVQGLPDLKGTFEGFFDDTETKPFGAASSTSPVRVYLYPSTVLPQSSGKYAYGLAWVDSSIDTSVAGAVTISSSYAAAGSWYVGF